IDTKVDLIRQPAKPAARELVVEALHLGVGDQIDHIRDETLRQQIRTSQRDGYSQRHQQRVANGQAKRRRVDQICLDLLAGTARACDSHRNRRGRDVGAGAHVFAGRRTYPEPRIVWINGFSEPLSTAWRRRLMCTSIRLLCGSKCRSHTPSSSIVRVTTCPTRRMRNSSSFSSRAVSSISRPPRTTRRASRSSSRSATFSFVASAPLELRRSSASM